MKNQKISTSLKKYHHKKRTRIQRRKELKVIFWILLAIGLIGFYTQHRVINPIEASAPSARMNNTLPIAKDIDVSKLSVPRQIALYAQKENFKWTTYLLRLSNCESKFNQYAINYNNGHSTDKGIFQWNDKYHPEISEACAYSIECSTKKTMEAINAGKQKMWCCDKYVRANPTRFDIN